MKYKEYIKSMVKNNNLLIFGDDPLKQFNPIFEIFENYYFQEPTQYTIDNLSSSILKSNIDTIILTCYKYELKTYESILRIKETQRVNILLCLFIDKSVLDEKIINISDKIFTPNISIENLEYKLYNSLNDKLKLELETNNKYKQNERYKDEFDIEVIHISEELKYISKTIDSGDISNEIFNKLKINIDKVVKIVNSHLMSSVAIKDLINDFKNYIYDLEIEKININAIEGFEQLSRLIEDISTFLDKYFIIKQIDDLYIVEDSLINSFEYVKKVFEGKQNSINDEDGSEMEFF